MVVTTSTFKMNPQTFNKIFHLFKKYCSCENVSGEEFIQSEVTSSDGLSLTNDEIEKFFLLVSHKNFLEAIKNNFVRHHNLRNYNEVRIIMIIFIILFGCDDNNVEELFQIFNNSKCAFKQKLLQYFCNENDLMQIALIGCKHFEDEYVLNRIINPVLNKEKIFKNVEKLLIQAKLEQRKPNPPTIPVHINLSQRRKIVPVVPVNTPVETGTFRAKEIPQSIYRPDSTAVKKLIGKFEENKLRAEKLLEQAKAFNKNFTKPKKPVVIEECPLVKFKAKKAPCIKQNIEIKGNVATVLREASRCIKEQEEEIKRIEAIVQGAATLDDFKELEEDDRKIKEQKSLEEIERKHLEGLLTFEEAILAKRKLIECNKERFKEFMEEREEFLKQIDEWKEREQERIKTLVKQIQETERNAKESEKKLKEERKKKADQLKDEQRKLLREAYEKQRDELMRKAKLIEEIKTLHQLKTLNQVKEFDRSETPNLGLLCQMSISDLQEKLSTMKIKMEEELEQKRRCIQKHKEKRREMIENVKNFITQSRMSKPKRTVVPIRPPKLTRNPDLDKLRGRLEYAREQRRHYSKLDEVVSYPTVYQYLTEKI